MTVESREFLDFAEWVQKADPNNKEISLRCAISRAYYGAFHAAIEHLDLNGYQDHKSVIKEVKKRNFALGNKLYALKSRRVDADYELNRNDFEYVNTCWYIEECKDAIGKIKKLKKDTI
jgi:uncharacterized protein (UPF0332 family)